MNGFISSTLMKEPFGLEIQNLFRILEVARIDMIPSQEPTFLSD